MSDLIIYSTLYLDIYYKCCARDCMLRSLHHAVHTRISSLHSTTVASRVYELLSLCQHSKMPRQHVVTTNVVVAAAANAVGATAAEESPPCVQ